MKRAAVALLLLACKKPAPPPPAGPSFAHDIQPVLERMCARARGCHGAEPTDSVTLDLRAAAAWRELVGHPAEARPGAMRVKPGAPDESFLVAKLRGRLGPREGKPMPIDASTGAPVVPSPVDSAYIDWILAPWIAAGAPNN